MTIGGSLVAALAVLEEMMPAEAAWEAVSLDDRWQLEQWGDDPEARAALDARRRDFLAAAQLPRAAQLGRATSSLTKPNKIGLALPAKPFGRNDRPNIGQAFVHVLVDQHIIIFGPVADFGRRPPHPAGNDLIAVGSALDAGGAPAPSSMAAG